MDPFCLHATRGSRNFRFWSATDLLYTDSKAAKHHGQSFQSAFSPAGNSMAVGTVIITGYLAGWECQTSLCHDYWYVAGSGARKRTKTRCA